MRRPDVLVLEPEAIGALLVGGDQQDIGAFSHGDGTPSSPAGNSMRCYLRVRRKASAMHSAPCACENDATKEPGMKSLLTAFTALFALASAHAAQPVYPTKSV